MEEQPPKPNVSLKARIIGAMLRKEKPDPRAVERARELERRADERTKARKQAKQEAVARRESDAILEAYRASGCQTVEEFEAWQEAQRAAAEEAEAERERRAREYVGAQRAMQRVDVRDVALELSRRHEGGRSVKLTALMVEGGLALDLDEAAWRVKTKPGQDLAASLEALGWGRTNRSGRRGWRPPRIAWGGVSEVESLPAPERGSMHIKDEV